jgi:hypothetical protein
VRLTLPIAIAITVLLRVLVLSYRQVIAAHPNGGGAYALAKKGPRPNGKPVGPRELTPNISVTTACRGSP